ncbi:MAG: hypothetical protein JNK02_15055 [Planctomycetes bacterium]|nr:hypothetical protein [Planctomycetota bacterium]
MSKLPLSLLLLLAFPLTACESMPRSASPDATVDEEHADGDEQDASPQEQVAKKKRALEHAQLELAIAQAEVQAALRKAADEVVDAELELREAAAALAHFLEVERDFELSKTGLGLDQAAWRLEAEKQELAELEAMYARDDVATLTKELVLQRGKKGVEFAERGLAHEQREAAMQRDFELPKKQRELETEQRSQENALREARAAAETSKLETDLKLRKARAEVEDAERELSAAQKKAAKP